jgi:hypothetical protein
MKGSGAMKPSSMFYVHEADVVQIHHFLEECSLCAKSLSGDIFMYRLPLRTHDTVSAPHLFFVLALFCFTACADRTHGGLQLLSYVWLCPRRGDTPFCSEECRQQQIEVDRAKHRRKKRAAAHAFSARSREHRQQQQHHPHHHHHHHHQHHHHHHHQQPQPRKAGMDTNPWVVDAGFPRAPALRV